MNALHTIYRYVHVNTYHHGHGRTMTEAEVVAMLIVMNAIALVALVYWYISAGEVKGMKDWYGWNPPMLVFIAIGLAGAIDFIVLLIVAISVIASWIS